jgi:type IX secretion system PorP/SprF family membrane protein
VKIFTKRILALAVLGLMAWSVSAQDIHYSQFSNSHLNLNPALAGMYEGDCRIYGHLRDQWLTTPVAYRTASLSYDRRFSNKAGKHTPWAAGFLFNYDRAGDSRFTQANLGLNVSYMQRLSSRQFLTVGVSPAFLYRGIDRSDMTWDNNYDGGTNNLPDGENLAQNNQAGFDLGAGLNWHIMGKAASRTSVDLGAAMFHIPQFETGFYSKRVDLPRRLSLYGMGTLQLNKKWDAVVNVINQNQGPHQELVFGASGKYHLSNSVGKQMAVSAGIGRRNKDAWYPQFGFFYNNWQVGLSYDANTSAFRKGSDRNGGPELSIIYTCRRPQVKDYCPLCPRYVSN